MRWKIGLQRPYCFFLIRKALEQTGNNLTRAGELLGTTRVHIQKKKSLFRHSGPPRFPPNSLNRTRGRGNRRALLK